MIGSILIFLIVLSILILVHELGHFIAAIKAGIWVEEFGFGLPPRVLGKKIGETIYSLNLFPFGGFVRLHGETGEGEIEFPEKAFLRKNKKTRSFIVIAGVVMNFLLGIFAFSLVYSFAGVPRKTDDVRIVGINTGSPAQKAGLIEGDIVGDIDGVMITTTQELMDIIETKKGQELVLNIKRGNELVKIPVTVREDIPEGEGALGIVITTTEIYFPPIWQRPIIGIYYGLKEALFWGSMVVGGFITIFQELLKGQVPKDVAGPVGIFALTSQAASFGILTLINFLGILSINLAIINIFPFPALDGGRLLFIGIEGILGRKVIPKIEAFIHTVGMAILLLLLLAITAHDIQRLITAGGISGFIDSIFK